jgi:hypothetical protein
VAASLLDTVHLDAARGAEEAALVSEALGSGVQYVLGPSAAALEALAGAAWAHVAAPVCDLLPAPPGPGRAAASGDEARATAAHAAHTMGGGIALQSDSDGGALTVLRTEDVAFAALPLDLVGLSNATVLQDPRAWLDGADDDAADTELQLAACENGGSLSFCRALLGAGAVGVYLSQWCTPDMHSGDLFAVVYAQCRAEPNRPLALASALRALLAEDPAAGVTGSYPDGSFGESGAAGGNDLRYKPRVWANLLYLGVPVVARAGADAVSIDELGIGGSHSE